MTFAYALVLRDISLEKRVPEMKKKLLLQVYVIVAITHVSIVLVQMTMSAVNASQTPNFIATVTVMLKNLFKK